MKSIPKVCKLEENKSKKAREKVKEQREILRKKKNKKKKKGECIRK